MSSGNGRAPRRGELRAEELSLGYGAHRAGDRADPAEAERAELEARKQVLYREIRDAEADRATGKLSEREFERLDRELRTEAIEVLKRLDRLDQRPPG